MRKILICLFAPLQWVLAVTAVFALALIVSGCYATKGDVQKELTKTRDGITAEQTKQLEERGIQNLKKIEALNNRIDNDILPQIKDLQAKLYSSNQDFHRLVEEHVTGLKKEIAELKSRIEALEAADKKQ